MADYVDVPLEGDWEIDVQLESRNATTGALEPLTGLSGVVAYFATAPNAAAIGSTTVALAERSGTPGTYFGILDAATVNAALEDYAWNMLYEVCSRSGDFLAGRKVRIVPWQGA